MNNVGNRERLIRVLLGLALIILGFVAFSGVAQWAAYFVGIILLATGVVGWCGIYSIIGFSSKGEGLDKITRRDIEHAVKAHAIATDSKIERVKAERPVAKKTPAKKKPVSKKATSAKSSTKNVTKKAPVKRKTTAKKPAAKKASASKASTTKKVPVKKKITTSKAKPKAKK